MIKECWNLIGQEIFLDITWKPDFSQACSFRRMLLNHKNFHFTQITAKTDDAVFLKSPKTMFFGHFWPFLAILTSNSIFGRFPPLIRVGFQTCPLWIKLTMGQFLLFFLCNFSSFFSYVGGILVTNHFLCYWLIGICCLFSKLWLTKGICDTTFDLQPSSELPQKPWHHGHNNRKFLLRNSSQKSPFFPVLKYALFGYSRYFTFKRKY